MDIEIIEACGIHGEAADVGEIVEVDTPTALSLIGMGKAKAYIETRDPMPQNRDPKPDFSDPKDKA